MSESEVDSPLLKFPAEFSSLECSASVVLEDCSLESDVWRCEGAMEYSSPEDAWVETTDAVDDTSV